MVVQRKNGSREIAVEFATRWPARFCDNFIVLPVYHNAIWVSERTRRGRLRWQAKIINFPSDLILTALPHRVKACWHVCNCEVDQNMTPRWSDRRLKNGSERPVYAF